MKRSSKAYDYHVHLREGHIIPFQDAITLKASTIKDLQNYPVDFYISPEATPWAPAAWTASGVYVNDDGEKYDIRGNHNQYTIHA